MYETLVMRSLANLSGKRSDAARADLETVAAERPDDVRGKLARGLIAYLDKDYVGALVDLSAGLDDSVLRPLALAYRARAYWGIGSRYYPQAVADARELVSLRPTDAVALLEAVRIHVLAASNERHDRAFELLAQVVQLQPKLRDQLQDDPELNALSSDERFHALLNGSLGNKQKK
jgi:tetratricopeptide (TPR) repeat protein